MNADCTDLYFLSALACKLSECLTEDELELLAANLQALGELLDVVLARRTMCTKESQ